MNDARPRIDIYSHHFTITRLNDSVRRAFLEYSKGLVEWDRVPVKPFQGRPKFVTVPKRIYASAKEDRSEMRLHINQLEGFKAQLYANGTDPEKGVEYVTHQLYEPEAVEFKMISGKTLYEQQVPVVEYLSRKDDIRAKVITTYTGSGKGLCSMTAMRNHGTRTVVVIKGEFLEKWVEELEQEIEIKKGDLLVIRGSSQLISLMNLALDDSLKAKIIVIGNRTFQNYLKSYERDRFFHDMYPIHPEQFYEKLKVGLRVIDEVHMDFHLNFKQDTYTHVPYTISMSATLDSDQDILNRMYRTMWPVEVRGPTMRQDPYIIANCLWYSIDRIDRIRYLNPKRQYDHVVFEKSIMRDKNMLQNYLRIIDLMVSTKYVADHAPGQKMLILCSTIQLCTIVADHLKALYPQHTVARYVGEDDWSELHNNDIVVSTIKSAGTAVDVKNLRYVLMTTALSSKQTNIQVIGRLRELRNFPGVFPEFMFLACRDIGKHCEYAMAKKAKVDSKVKSFMQSYLPIRV